MSPRERVLAAPRREVPDRVPWIEGITGNGIASAVCGRTIRVDWSVAPDGFPTQPGADLAEEQIAVNQALGKDNIQFSAFAYAMADDPKLIVLIHDAYADWTGRVVPIMEDIGFDVVWGFDDVAFNNGPVFSPAFYRRYVLPQERQVVASFSRPFISHSDGNMTPLLDDWLGLGQDAIHPIQPDVMDIERVKERYGARVAIVGNIAMEDLVRREPEDIREQVRKRIEVVGRNGGYLLSSSNSLTDDMKPGNVLAMSRALDEYGWY
jgi:uroporphyrinogen decarboxylase